MSTPTFVYLSPSEWIDGYDVVDGVIQIPIASVTPVLEHAVEYPLGADEADPDTGDIRMVMLRLLQYFIMGMATQTAGALVPSVSSTRVITTDDAIQERTEVLTFTFKHKVAATDIVACGLGYPEA